MTKLIPRLYPIDSGRIFIDDYDIAKVSLSTLRRQIGIVPQDSLLFEGTIAQNIALNDPQASDDSIIEAAKIACAHDFIMSLGLDTLRKLLAENAMVTKTKNCDCRTPPNPQLLIMDEATSALDYNTEKQLCANLQNWAAGRTVLFITHRLSTIKNSDQILLMNDGLLVESGSHSELLSLNQRYAII